MKETEKRLVEKIKREVLEKRDLYNKPQNFKFLLYNGFIKILNEVIEKTIRETDKEIQRDLKLAKQCLNFKGFFCYNQNCENKYCPFNKEVKNE